MIKIRKYVSSDAGAVDEIYDRCHKDTFGRPDLSKVISSAIVELDGKIVGYGALETILEAMIIIDMDKSIDDRIAILNELIGAAKFISKDRKFKRFYMFPSGTQYQNFLKNRYDFKVCSTIMSCELEPEG